MLGGGWRISKRNAILGLIIHLHLDKKVFVCSCSFVGQGCLASGMAGSRQQAIFLLFFGVSFILVVSPSWYFLMAEMIPAVPSFHLSSLVAAKSSLLPTSSKSPKTNSHWPI